MQFSESGNKVVLRLDKNDEIIESIIWIAKSLNIVSGYFTAVGAVISAELRFFYQNKMEYYDQKYNGEYEIASLTGNISRFNSEPHVHAHIVLSDSEMRCYGGHLKNGVVGPTTEIWIEKTNIEISRSFKNHLGLNTMDIQ